MLPRSQDNTMPIEDLCEKEYFLYRDYVIWDELLDTLNKG